MAIGVPYDLFWHLNPTKLESFNDAFELMQKMRDEDNWMKGAYIYNAVYIAVHNVVSEAFGKKGNAEYINKPMFTNIEGNNELSEEEKDRQVDLFFKQQNAMRINWQRNHGKNED